MRQVKVKLKKGSKPFHIRSEFYERDVLEGLVGCTPGQWVLITAEGEKDRLLALANPMSKSSAPLRVLGLATHQDLKPEDYIKDTLAKAVQKRDDFPDLSKGRRIVYGDSDGLPGVIVDEYLHCALIQINTAGMDQYRDLFKSELHKLTSKTIYFLDNQEYRKQEGLPIFEGEKIPAIEVVENDLRFFISEKVLQKIGYYYDHRMNRKKLKQWIQNIESDFVKGVDLFSYVGSWGLNALSGGVKEMTFVDQGDLKGAIEKNLEVNGMAERGQFIRANVFDWLKTCEETFDVVISDPPAFSKNLKNKSKALGGYQKLHRSLSRIVHKGSLLAIGSCTHGVSLEELDLTVKQGFADSSYTLQLLELGLQGPDHGISHLGDSQNYIKFILYRVL